MYTVSDVLELGAAHDLVLSEVKEALTWDDSEDHTMEPLEYFDE